MTPVGGSETMKLLRLRWNHRHVFGAKPKGPFGKECLVYDDSDCFVW